MTYTVLSEWLRKSLEQIQGKKQERLLNCLSSSAPVFSEGRVKDKKPEGSGPTTKLLSGRNVRNTYRPSPHFAPWHQTRAPGSFWQVEVALCCPLPLLRATRVKLSAWSPQTKPGGDIKNAKGAPFSK